MFITLYKEPHEDNARQHSLTLFDSHQIAKALKKEFRKFDYLQEYSVASQH